MTCTSDKSCSRLRITWWLILLIRVHHRGSDYDVALPDATHPGFEDQVGSTPRTIHGQVSFLPFVFILHFSLNLHNMQEFQLLAKMLHCTFTTSSTFSVSWLRYAISHAFIKKVLSHHSNVWGGTSWWAERTNESSLGAVSFVYIHQLNIIHWTVIHSLSFVCVVFGERFPLHDDSQV